MAGRAKPTMQLIPHLVQNPAEAVGCVQKGPQQNGLRQGILVHHQHSTPLALAPIAASVRE